MQPGPISLEQACAKRTRLWSPRVAGRVAPEQIQVPESMVSETMVSDADQYIQVVQVHAHEREDAICPRAGALALSWAKAFPVRLIDQP